MRAFARIVLSGALVSGLILGVASTAAAANYMYEKPESEQLLESQQREADLAKKLATQEAANAALESQLEAADKRNKSLSEENASLTTRLGSAESAMAALAATDASGDKEVAALKEELAGLQQAATRGPFDLGDTGHALLALTALLAGTVLTAGAAFAIWRKRSTGGKPDPEPVSGQ
jgi:small-conductance mechanosensitive channel